MDPDPSPSANWRLDALVLGKPSDALAAAARIARVIRADPSLLRMEPLVYPDHGLKQGVWLPPRYVLCEEKWEPVPQPVGTYPTPNPTPNRTPELVSLEPDTSAWLAPVLAHHDDVMVCIIKRWNPSLEQLQGAMWVVAIEGVWPPSCGFFEVTGGSPSSQHPFHNRALDSNTTLFGVSYLFDAPNDFQPWHTMWNDDALKGYFALQDLAPAYLPSLKRWSNALALYEKLPPAPASAPEVARL